MDANTIILILWIAILTVLVVRYWHRSRSRTYLVTWIDAGGYGQQVMSITPGRLTAASLGSMRQHIKETCDRTDANQIVIANIQPIALT